MSWGDVWVCGDETRPAIGGEGPESPWILAGAVSREEKAIIEATQRLQNTRGSHSRAIDFYLQVHSPDVAVTRTGAKPSALAFEPDGLWVAVDLTVADRPDSPRFIVFTQRVRTATAKRRPPELAKGARRPRALIPLRGRARSGGSALEWAYRAPAAR
jgi:hypothetical protein